jgi:ferredoxin|tara:strand:- start:2793 stop:3137 length:345 start_codon:yes stop_codon:yes gene_type:complete
MAYVVTQDCIKCKYTDCVEVCPVDCFYEGADMLVINPDECIDCGVCEPECPADAIIADNNPKFTQRLLDINDKMSQVWPVIVEQIDAPADADDWNPNKGYTKDKTELLDQFDKD